MSNLRILLLLFVCASHAGGQSIFGEIRGTITDPASAAVENANVIVLNKQTGEKREVTSDRSGNYSVVNLEGSFSNLFNHNNLGMPGGLECELR